MSGMPGIAVVGMAGRFPGAPSLQQFWANIRAGVDSISRFSDAELADAGVDPALLSHPNYVKAGTVLENAELFDAAFFGYHRREAEVLDPQQRVFLECAWHALESAGYDPDRYPGAIGVFAGMALNTYLLNNLLPERQSLDRLGMFQAMLGSEKDYLSTRVSYKLNLRGPALTLQTACSTSLVAIHVACQNLWTFQCDMALAGGVAVHSPQKNGYLHQDGMILSPDGRCRTFDIAAQGTIGGSGVGIVVLKRLEDALRDGDTIQAVIRGSAINNDGSTKAGFTAPSVQGQSEVIALAQAMAGVDADTIDYVEAHGTATPLGDPIEVAALTQAFRATTARTGYCALGSIKSNIGHADAAAGVAGFIKTVLALSHGELPPTLHFTTPNPAIDFERSPFFVNTVLTPWPDRPHARRAGVSSFGIGGTNAHVILEEAPAVTPSSPPRDRELLVLSARTQPALDEASRNLAAHLRAHPAENLADVAFTLQIGRHAFDHRRTLVCGTAIEAAGLLESPGGRRMVTAVHEPGTRSIAFMFPGGGASYPGMARELYRREPLFRSEVDAGLAHLRPHVPHDLRAILLSDSGTQSAIDAMERPSIGLPLLFLVEYSLARLLAAWGIRPAAMIGHSMGEYTAACLAGVVSFEDALAIVALRGRLFERLPEGGMLSVPLTEAAVRTLLPASLSVAVVNGPSLVVVSGPVNALRSFDEDLRARGVETVRLRISVAAHSDLVAPILDEFEQALGSCRLSPPTIPYVSNITGTWITGPEATDPQYWSRHLRQPVRFADGLALLLGGPNQILIEVGPGRTLANLARPFAEGGAGPIILPTIRHTQDDDDDVAFLLGSIGRLWVNGVEPDWLALHGRAERRRVTLPVYPFQRQRYWIDPPVRVGATPSDTRATVPSTDRQPDLEPETKEGSQVTPPTSEPSDHRDGSRRDAILARLTDVVHDMSGLSSDELAPDVTFLELGFDSLFLTQLTQAFRNAFQVPLKFRQLLEDLSTLGRLADHLAAVLPPDAFAVSIVAAPGNAVELVKLTKTIAPAVDAGQGPLEQIIRQQLEIMSQQLAVLGATPVRPVAEPDSATPATAFSPPRIEPTPTPQRFGPYEAVDKRAAAALEPIQQSHLDTLIDRYTKRTAQSKRLTQRHRGALADPRAVTGFRPQWKELIYQIAMTRSAGSRMWDVDGNEYVDFTMGFGVNLFGHSPAFVIEAAERQLRAGLELGVLSPLAGQVADLICELTGFDRVTFANTGSDAILGALRAARAVTGRDRIAMFSGGYHGMNDEVMVKSIASKSGARRSVPAAAGVPRSAVEQVLVLDYDDPNCLELLKAHAGELAAVLVEPVQSRRPSLQPRALLHEIRALTQRAGTALIFDELITGFRLHPGGAQAWFGIEADLATYGKVLSGGIPMAAIAGRATFMDAFDGGTWTFGDASTPEAGVTFYGSTFTRHPLGLASALAVLTHLKDEGPELQDTLNRRTTELVGRLTQSFERAGTAIRVEHCGSLFQIKFPDDRDNPFAQLTSWERLLPYYLRLRGVHIWDRAAFLSTAHTDADLDVLVDAVDGVLAEMRAAGFLQSSPVAAAGSPHRPALPSTFSLTPGQSEIWLAAQMSSEASSAYNESAVLRLRGALDRGALEQAINLLVERHEALRTTFNADGSLQEVGEARPADLSIIDLAQETDQGRASQVDALLTGAATAPFDLENGPLTRFLLLQLSAQEHLFSMTIHHIVCDGSSMGLLLTELAEVYSALRDGTPVKLPEPKPFREFAQEEAALTLSEAGRADETFWLERLSGDVAVLDLPSDRPRPVARTYRGAQESRTLDRALCADLKKLSATRGCTLVTTLLAAFQILLHRLSNQSDIVVGLPVAVQSAMSARIVGHCTNLLPLRTSVTPEATFADFLRAARSAMLDAYEHQHCTFGQLLRSLRIARHANRPPLVQVVFNVDKAEPLRLAGLEVDSVQTPRHCYNFEIGINCVDSAGELLVQCNFQPDVQDGETIRRWLGHYETLLRAIVEDPDRPLWALPLLSAAERTTVVETWNQTATGWPPALLHTAVETQAARTPAAPAVIGATETLSYAALEARAIRPRTATESALSEIWSDLLGTSAFGVSDSFFDVGGHSLLAIRLFARIEKRFGVKLRLSALFTSPSIEQLARLIVPASSDRTRRSLVPLQPDERKPPLFLVSGIGAELFTVGALAGHLADQFSVYGLEPTPDLLASPVTVEEICRCYFAEVVAAQPEGEIRIGGFCAGAVFAFELAHQLRAAKREVGLLVIIDHEMVSDEADAAGSSNLLLSFARNLPLWVRQDLLPAGAGDIVNRLRSKARVAVSWLRRAGQDGTSQPDIRDVLGMWAFPDDLVPQIEHLFAACQAYRPVPYDGRILLIRPQTLPLLRPQPRGTHGWVRIASGELAVETVPGSHSTILNEPFVAALAETLKQHLTMPGRELAATAVLRRPSGTGRSSR